MWKRLREMPGRLWRWAQQSPAERRASRKRKRFWAELRAGEREAEDSARP